MVVNNGKIGYNYNGCDKMIKQINLKSKIFKSDIFQSDEYLFNDVLNNRVQLFSDEENYIVFYDEINNKIWIWSKDKINSKILDEIERIIWKYLMEEENCQIFCKEKLYRMLLKEDFISLNLDDYSETNYYKYKDSNIPKKCDGEIYIPNIYDIDKISRYYYENCLENKRIIISYDNVKKYISKLVSPEEKTNQSFFTWKNNQNEIVSLLILTENDGYANISNLFTPPVYRKCGYSSNLLYNITQEVINTSMVPIILTNGQYDDEFLNKMGYVKSGMLVSSSCSLKNIKRL